MKYFPDALAEIARASQVGNDQHHPNTPLHWDRAKSTDEYDSCARHLLDRAAGDVFDEDGTRHMAKVAWRALAALQKELEEERDEETAEELPIGGTKIIHPLPPPRENETDYDRIQRRSAEREAELLLQDRLRAAGDGSVAAQDFINEYEAEIARLRR
jgi:hypothetical protein